MRRCHEVAVDEAQSYDLIVAEPDLRILQANERTLLAWIRTGMAAMAFGFVVSRLTLWLHFEHPLRETPVGTRIGLVIVAFGIVCPLFGAARFRQAQRAIVEDRSIVPSTVGPLSVVAFLTLLGIATLIYLAVTE